MQPPLVFGIVRASFHAPPPQWGGLDLDSRSSGCARLGGGVGPPLGVVVEEVEFDARSWRHSPDVRVSVVDFLSTVHFTSSVLTSVCVRGPRTVEKQPSQLQESH